MSGFLGKHFLQVQPSPGHSAQGFQTTTIWTTKRDICDSFHEADDLQWRIQETGKGGSKLSSAKRAKFGVTPTSGAVKLGKIPFSATILDCVELLRTVN